METQNLSPGGFCFPFHQNLTEISACLCVSTKGIQTCTDEKDKLPRLQAPVPPGWAVSWPAPPPPPPPASHSFAKEPIDITFFYI